MQHTNIEPKKPLTNDNAERQRENSYNLAKLLRIGSRELARQFNIKRAKKTR